jgi:hypothetical protein
MGVSKRLTLSKNERMALGEVTSQVVGTESITENIPEALIYV